MTATEWTTIMVVDATVLLLCLIGESLYRAFRRALDADTLRHIQADTAHYDFHYGGSAGAIGIEPHPAAGLPGTGPVAGPELQVGDSCLDRDSFYLPKRKESRPAPRSLDDSSSLGAGTELQAGDSLDRDSAVATPSDESQPASGTSSAHPGAGPESQTAVAAPDGDGGLGHSNRSVPVPLALALAGPQPHPRGEASARPDPRLVAPTIGSAA
jgi:hypothetical protein